MADAAITLPDIRAKYPAYNDMSDAQLAQGLHDKFYSDMPFEAFAGKIGFSSASAAPATEGGPPPNMPATEPASPTRDAIDSGITGITNAATNAFNNTPEFIAPETREALNKYGGTGPMGAGEFVNQVGHGVTNVIGAANAGMAALSKAAMEVFGEKGGRDALALLSTLLMAPEAAQAALLLKARSPSGMPSTPSAEIPTPPARFLNEVTMPPDTVGLTPLHRAMDLIQHDTDTYGTRGPDAGVANQSIAEIGNAANVDTAIAAAGKAVDAPVPRPVSQWTTSITAPTEEATTPQPMSAGSAASREGTPANQIALSTADMKANRRVAEMNELLASPQSNDTTVYVPGSYPTLAERSGDPEISQTENMLRQRNSGSFVGEGKVLTENNKARVALVDAQTVPDTTLNSMRKDRTDRWLAASDDILPTAKPADLTPAADWVGDQLSDPRIQENDAVRGVLEDFQNRLFDADGNLKDDPAAIWGMHDHLQNLLNKAKDPLNQTSAEKFSESQILKAKSMVDQALNVATDNKFQSALQNYAEDSKPINAGVLMNSFRPKLTNMAGDIHAPNFHRFVLGLAKERGDPGIDPSMDISDTTMRALLDVDTDLKRAGLIKLGAAAGSPTNLLGALATSAGLDAAHSVLGTIPGVGKVINAVPSAIAKYRLDRLTEKHLAPPEGGYRTRE